MTTRPSVTIAQKAASANAAPPVDTPRSVVR